MKGAAARASSRSSGGNGTSVSVVPCSMDGVVARGVCLAPGSTYVAGRLE